MAVAGLEYVADVVEAAASGTCIGPAVTVGDGAYAGGGSFVSAGRLV